MVAARLAEVRRSSSITPTLMVWRGRPSKSSTASNSRLVKAASSGAMHLGLDDIDRAGAAVDERLWRFRSCKADQAGDDGVQNAFGRLLAVRQLDRGRGHQMADIADQHQAAARAE